MVIYRTSFERRRRDRFYLDVKIKYVLNHADEVFLEGDIVNISALGICLNTSTKLEEGQEIIFKNVLPAGHQRATVVWIGKTGGNYYKVGLQFK